MVPRMATAEGALAWEGDPGDTDYRGSIACKSALHPLTNLPSMPCVAPAIACGEHPDDHQSPQYGQASETPPSLPEASIPVPSHQPFGDISLRPAGTADPSDASKP